MDETPAIRMARVAILVSLWPLLQAASLTPALGDELTRSGREVASTVSPDETPCVLLRNDNVLFGRAYQIGEYVIVQTGEAAEIRLPRQEVLCWADSLRSLHRYRVDRRQARDLSAIVRDARWCLQHNLFDLTAEELRRIRDIDPGNPEAHRIEAQLRRQFAATSTSDANSSSTKSLETSSPLIRVVGYEDPISDPEDLPEDVSAESAAVDPLTLRRFASHIQPMLTNRCGRCHDTTERERQGWKLDLPSAGTRASARITRDNLVATLAYVDAKAPEESVLLMKATTAHGGEPAPLDARNAKAIEALRHWLWMVSVSLPQTSLDRSQRDNATRLAGRGVHPIQPRVDSIDFSEPLDSPAGEWMLQQAVPVLSPLSSVTPKQSESAVTQSTVTQSTVSQSTVSRATSAGPSRLPQVDNPFDPELFNRRLSLDVTNRE